MNVSFWARWPVLHWLRLSFVVWQSIGGGNDGKAEKIDEAAALGRLQQIRRPLCLLWRKNQLSGCTWPEKIRGLEANDEIQEAVSTDCGYEN